MKIRSKGHVLSHEVFHSRPSARSLPTTTQRHSELRWSMVEVCPNLFIGSASDYEMLAQTTSDRWVVHACKEPYHRQLLGYTGRAAPRSHPEYLVGRRQNRLFLNLVDADDPAYIPKEIIDCALSFVGEALASGSRALVHCNLGESRSPSIGLLYLATHTDRISRDSLAEAERGFRALYPFYNPKAGIRGFLLAHWSQYVPAQGCCPPAC